MGAQIQSELHLVPGRGPYSRAGMTGQHDGRAGHTAAGALDEHCLAGLQTTAGEEHPVGGEPGCWQAGRLREGQRGGFGNQVVRGNRDPFGERALVLLTEQAATRIERLVPATGLRRTDHGVHDDLGTVGGHPGGVAAQNHR